MVQRERCWPVHDECRRAFADGVVDNNDGYTLAKVRTQHTRRRRPCDEHASSVFCTVKVHAEPAHAPAACPARRRLRCRRGAPSAFCRGGSKPARQRCAKQGELCRWIYDAGQHDEHGDACSHACWASRICCNKSSEEVPMALTRFQEQTLCFFPPLFPPEGGEAFPKSNDLLTSLHCLDRLRSTSTTRRVAAEDGG